MKYSHEEILEEIRKIPGMINKRTHRIIKRYIEQILKQEGVPAGEIKKYLDYEWRFKYRPDGFIINREERAIFIYEVEDWHRMGVDRLAHYFDFMDWLGNFGIESQLCLYDRFGEKKNYKTGDLLRPWLEFMNGKRCSEAVCDELARKMGMPIINKEET